MSEGYSERTKGVIGEPSMVRRRTKELTHGHPETSGKRIDRSEEKPENARRQTQDNKSEIYEPEFMVQGILG